MYPQLGDHDPAFIAVERDERGHENSRIFRRGKDTALWSCHFPPRMNSIHGLVLEDFCFQDCEFKSRVWREVERHATDGSGFGIAGRPMVVDNAVDAAAAMHGLVQGWAKCCITVDPDSGRVSYQHDDCCVICSVREPFFQFVKIGGLPPSFLDLKQAQFLADPSMNFQKGCVYVWTPPPGSGGKSLVFGLSESTEFSHEDYGDFGDQAVFVVYLRTDEHDPAFQAVEWNPEQCVCRRFAASLFCNNLSMYRSTGGIGILRHGQEKEMHTHLDFPHLVQDVDTSTFEDATFSRPLWRRPNAADGAGSIRLRGPGSSSAYVTHEARKRFCLQLLPHHIFD